MNMSSGRILLFLASGLTAACVSASEAPKSELRDVRDVKWGYLNPLRGELSPGAAELWGDRAKNSATGMLVKFKKGFSSPPHIHNISYRGIVIDGLMHNDDPSAEVMWMPPGSFWTQPAGENHITSANGATNLIFLEIDSGPYLVKPSEEGFDNGERPINLHASNLVWINQADLQFVDAEGVDVCFLWGRNENQHLGGALVKLPKGFNGTFDVVSDEFRAVVIQGRVDYKSDHTQVSRILAPGSYFGSSGRFKHDVSISGGEGILYIRTDGKFQVFSD